VNHIFLPIFVTIKIDNMDKNKLNTEITDFAWVIKILQSSETKEHLKVSDKLFYQFIDKWGLSEGEKFKKYCNIYDKFRFVSKHRNRIKSKN
jgi:hypothetical protein